MSALLLLLGCGEPRSPDPAGPAPQAAAPHVPERLGLGRPATAEEIALWDLDVEPSGEGLPPGRGTVEEGRALYAGQCASCHGLKGEGASAPALVGRSPAAGFADDPKLPKTIGNWWPYATTLYDYTRRSMPQNAPGTLSPDQLYALVAFLLAENGAVPADFIADARSLPAVQMPTRVQFIPDDRLETNTFR